MWSHYVLVVSFIFYVCYCSEFSLDPEHCLLSSKNNSLIIDLSSSYSYEEVPGTNYTAYFSLCPKRLKKCPKTSFMCLIDQVGNVIDLASEIEDITFEGLYNVALSSPHGRGNVFIMCSKDTGEISPLFETIQESQNSSLHFTYFVKWLSSSSCPLRQYKTRNSCTLYTKEQSYDLRPLQYSTDLYAVNGSDKYLINFCKDVSHVNCRNSSVCAIRGGIAHSIAPVEDSTLQHIESRGLTLTYKNIQGGNTIIGFVCSLNSTEPIVQFIPEEEDILFNVTTSMICPPIKMNCLIHDRPGVIYDLSVLHNLMKNWYLDLKDGKKLIFNVCGPLNYIPHFLCSGGPYYACLVDSSNTTLALGYDSEVQVLKPGLVSLKILGRSVDNKMFFLNITFECARHGVYPTVTKDGSSLNTYSIRWKTEAACPSEISKGEKCKLKNTYHENEVDLSSLHNNTGDYTVLNGNESFRINICGHLNRSCSQTNDAYICYKNKNGKELAIGLQGGSEPIFKDGQIFFHLEGEPCNAKVAKSKIKIILVCEYFEEGRPNSPPTPEYIPSANECEFYFLWRTDVICSESVSTKCLLEYNNVTFDLSPLKNVKENYVVPHNASTNIILNVCHSVLPGHRIRCHINSGACLVNDDVSYILSHDYQMKKGQEGLGLVSDVGHLEYVNGEIHLTYINGGICPFGPEATHKTVIIFECNKLDNDTHPFLVSSDDCEYIFKWRSRFACPIGASQPTIIPLPSSRNTTENEKKCSITVMNKTYNLTALMGKDWHVENKHLILGVCNPVKSPGCPSNSGACLMSGERGTENIGSYNTNLKFEEDMFHLYYKTSNSRQTKIIFICSKVDLPPKYIAERKTSDGLTTYISWPTSLVCDKKVEESCCHQVEKLCDAFNGTYNVPVSDNQSVFLSLCRAVSPDVGLLCPHSSASCIGTELNNSFTDEKSLGSVLERPIFNKDNSAVIEYSNGSLCKNGIKYSTSIRMFCDYNHNNVYPQFVKTVGCHYEFDWGTHLLCNHSACIVPFTNKSNNSYTHFVGADMYIYGRFQKYILNLCKPSDECGSYICKSSTSKNWHPVVGSKIEKKVFNEGKNQSINYFLQSANPSPNDVFCGAGVELYCDSSEMGPILVEVSTKFHYLFLIFFLFLSIYTLILFFKAKRRKFLLKTFTTHSN